MKVIKQRRLNFKIRIIFYSFNIVNNTLRNGDRMDVRPDRDDDPWEVAPLEIMNLKNAVIKNCL